MAKKILKEWGGDLCPTCDSNEELEGFVVYDTARPFSENVKSVAEYCYGLDTFEEIQRFAFAHRKDMFNMFGDVYAEALFDFIAVTR